MEWSRYRLFVNKFGAGNAHAQPGRARGPRPTWGRGARRVRWALDVGLDPLVLSYQEERTRTPQPQMPAIAPVHTGMTWLLDWQNKPLLSPRQKRNIIHPLAGLRKSCNFAGRNQ